MNDRKPKKKPTDKERQEGDKSIEINMLMLLVRKYPEKARELARRLASA